jgi:hypothetical protein
VTSRAPAARRRLTALNLALLLAMAACAAPQTGGTSATSVVSKAPGAAPVSAKFTVPPPPGPVLADRGEMIQEVQVVDGYASMLIHLRNVGSEPVTFLNTLYDYEPHQLYEPLVRVEWTGGAAAVGTRDGRFFPSPAVVAPGQRAVYLLAGVRVSGAGQIGSVVSHIKYCPTRGMDDVPADVLTVSGLTWSTRAGITTVLGTIIETAGTRRATPPTIGVAFFDASGAFVGGVVQHDVGARLEPNERRTFEISGPGVLADRIGRASGWAWVS